MNILYVEDDLLLAETIKAKLTSRYNIDIVPTYKAAINKVENKEYDLTIIDYFLPDSNGVKVCKKIREFDAKIPILIFTTNHDKKTIIEALDSGADDFLTKPFDFQELEARIRSLIRRIDYSRTNTTISLGDLAIDTAKHIVICNKQLIHLPRQEFLLLKYILHNKNKLISRQELYEHVWGSDDFYNSNTIDVHIRRIRNRLKKYSPKEFIKSIYGLGYRAEIM